MARRSRFSTSAVALLLAATGAAAQDTSAFLAAARRGAAPFGELGAAIAAGYRPVGPETPTMGRHWVHPGLLLAARVDPERPAILSYATIAGRPTLVGVAYALPSGALVPQGPAPRDAWHVHDGTVMDEAVKLDHSAHAAPDTVDAGLAVLHAWLFVPNPAGMFAPDNRNLPFVVAWLEAVWAAPVMLFFGG